jgi:hypothetical protein
MPKLEYFVVCESVSVDRETNRISLFNVVEDLRPVRNGETGHPVHQFVAVSAWNREPGDEGKDFQAIVRIQPPDDQSKDFSINFQMERPRQRLILRLLGVAAGRPGNLRFELLLNSQHFASHTVTIHPPLAASDVADSGGNGEADSKPAG